MENQNTNINNREGRVPVFGFRTGKIYKMLIAFLYYAFMGYSLITYIIEDVKYSRFEPVDVVLAIIKYIFFAVFLYSPLIFLSDFKYVYKIPLFKRKDKTASAIGLIIVLAFCFLMIQLNNYCGSNLYKNSVKEYRLKTIAQISTPRDKKLDSDKLSIMLARNEFAKGYEVQVSTAKDFKKVLLASKKDKYEFTIKSPKLVNQKKLFVRARSFGTVTRKDKKGKWTIKEIVKGPWSDVREVKIIESKANKKTTKTKASEVKTTKKQNETKKKDTK